MQEDKVQERGKIQKKGSTRSEVTHNPFRQTNPDSTANEAEADSEKPHQREQAFSIEQKLLKKPVPPKSPSQGPGVKSIRASIQHFHKQLKQSSDNVTGDGPVDISVFNAFGQLIQDVRIFHESIPDFLDDLYGLLVAVCKSEQIPQSMKFYECLGKLINLIGASGAKVEPFIVYLSDHFQKDFDRKNYAPCRHIFLKNLGVVDSLQNIALQARLFYQAGIVQLEAKQFLPACFLLTRAYQFSDPMVFPQPKTALEAFFTMWFYHLLLRESSENKPSFFNLLFHQYQSVLDLKKLLLLLEETGDQLWSINHFEKAHHCYEKIRETMHSLQERSGGRLSSDVLKDFDTYLEKILHVQKQTVYRQSSFFKEKIAALIETPSFVTDQRKLTKLRKLKEQVPYNKAVRLFMIELIERSKDILGPPPCHYSLAMMGSLSREEACFYSDLEFMLLVERQDLWVSCYFRALVECVHLQIIMLGESPDIKDIPEFKDVVLGLRFDTALVPFSSKPHETLLFGTIKDVVLKLIPKVSESCSLQRPGMYGSTIAKLAQLHTQFLEGDQPLFEAFQIELKQQLLAVKNKAGYHAHHLLVAHMTRVADVLRDSGDPYLKKTMSSKLLLQYSSYWVQSINLFYLNKTMSLGGSTFNQAQQLMHKGVISPLLALSFQFLNRWAWQLRQAVQEHAGTEKGEGGGIDSFYIQDLGTTYLSAFSKEDFVIVVNFMLKPIYHLITTWLDQPPAALTDTSAFVTLSSPLEKRLRFALHYFQEHPCMTDTLDVDIRHHPLQALPKEISWAEWNTFFSEQTSAERGDLSNVSWMLRQFVFELGYYFGVVESNPIKLLDQLCAAGHIESAFGRCYQHCLQLMFDAGAVEEKRQRYWFHLIIKPLQQYHRSEPDLPKCIDPYALYTLNSNWGSDQSVFGDMVNEIVTTLRTFWRSNRSTRLTEPDQRSLQQLFLHVPQSSLCLIEPLIQQWQRQNEHDEIYESFYRWMTEQCPLSAETEALRQVYIESLQHHASEKPALIERLLEMPRADGVRQSERVAYDTLNARIKAVTTSTPQAHPEGITVTLTLPDGSQRYLAPDAIDTLIERQTGDLKRNRQGKHHVFAYQNLVFKQKPDHPGMSSAIDLLTRRIVGHGTPANRLVCCHFDDPKHGIDKTYSLLVSSEVPGETLQSWEKSHPNQTLPISADTFTELLLMTVLTLPGDGALRNFVLALLPDGTVYPHSVDNAQMWVEPMVRGGLLRWKKLVQLRSAILCLPQMRTLALSERVLRWIVQLNTLAIVNRWLQDVAVMDRQYAALFSKLLQEQLYKENKNDPAVCGVLFPEGGIIRLVLTIDMLLKPVFEHALQRKQLLYATEVLRYVHLQLATRYQSVLNKTRLSLSGRYQEISNHAQVSVTSGDALRASLGELPTFETVASRERFSPQQARQELQALVFKSLEQDTVVTRVSKAGLATVRIDFSTVVRPDGQPDTHRQRLILAYLLELLPSLKLQSLALPHCVCLDDPALAVLLSKAKTLVTLDLRSCPKLTHRSVEMIARCCRQLETLYLSNNSSIQKFCISPGLGSDRAITFPALRTLHISNCEQLCRVWLTAPELAEFKGSRLHHLKEIHLNCPHLVRLDIHGNPMLPENFDYLMLSPQLQYVNVSGCVAYSLAQMKSNLLRSIKDNRFTMKLADTACDRYFKGVSSAVFTACVSDSFFVKQRERLIEIIDALGNDAFPSILHMLAARTDCGDFLLRLLRTVEKLCVGMIEMRDKNGYTALHIAVECQTDPSVCLALLKALGDRAADVIAQRTSSGSTVLRLAVRHQTDPSVCLALLKALGDRAADVIARSVSDGWTVLHLAAQCQTDPSVCLALLKALGDRAAEVIAYPTGDGWTVLHQAALKETDPSVWLALLEALGDRAADVIAYPDSHGWTVLHQAALRETDPSVCLALLKTLGDRAADLITYPDSNEVTVLHMAARYQTAPSVWLALLKTLGDRAADVIAHPDSHGWTVLHQAACNQTDPLVCLALLKALGDRAVEVIAHPTGDGWTVLHMAACNQTDPSVCLALLKALGDRAAKVIAHPGSHGWTVLCLAVRHQTDPSVCLALLEALGDQATKIILQSDENGKTVLQLAKEHQTRQVYEDMLALVKQAESKAPSVKASEIPEGRTSSNISLVQGAVTKIPAHQSIFYSPPLQFSSQARNWLDNGAYHRAGGGAPLIRVNETTLKLTLLVPDSTSTKEKLLTKFSEYIREAVGSEHVISSQVEAGYLTLILANETLTNALVELLTREGFRLNPSNSKSEEHSVVSHRFG